MNEAGMVEASFNIFDAGVITIVGLSALMSFMRGFIKEILSLGAWLGASVITAYAFLDVAEMIKPQINNAMVAGFIAAALTFFTALICISIINTVLLQYLKRGSEVGLLDNGLGLVFGAARGALLVSLGYFIISFVIAEKDFPPWLANAKTKPYVAKGGELLTRLAPEYLQLMSEETQALESNVADELPDSTGDVRFEEDIEAPGEDPQGGYEWMKVEELEKLLEKSQPPAEE